MITCILTSKHLSSFLIYNDRLLCTLCHCEAIMFNAMSCLVHFSFLGKIKIRMEVVQGDSLSIKLLLPPGTPTPFVYGTTLYNMRSVGSV